jgi:hypothetical protein
MGVDGEMFAWEIIKNLPEEAYVEQKGWKKKGGISPRGSCRE